MHDDRRLTEVRLDRFLRDRIAPAVYPRSTPLMLSSWDAPGEPVPAVEALRHEFTPQEHGAAWGRPWSTKWLRLQGDVPDGWGTASETGVEILVDLGFSGDLPGFQCEGIAWRADGTIIKAISPRNQYIPLKLLGGGMAVDFYVEAAANPDLSQNWTFAATPYGDKATSGSEPKYRLGRIAIAELNQTVWELQQDALTLRGLMHELPMDLPRRHEILRALERMLDVMDPDDVAGTAAAGRAELAGGARLGRRTPSAHRVVATGHAHIDSAWLWPVRETIRKCARTFSNVIALMDEHPGFIFACSSAQQFAWMKEYYPSLFGRIRDKVPGRPVRPVGGMWVESDTNMPGGEAMARQFLEGKSFFPSRVRRGHRGSLAAGLIRVFRGAPADHQGRRRPWFLTQKISWNQINRMPHHTFNWRRNRRHRGVHPFPAGGQLQLRSQRAGTWRTPSGTTGPRARSHLAGSVRVRRRRRRPDPRDDRPRRSAGRILEGSPKVRIGSAASSSGEARGRVPRSAGLGGGDVPGTAPRHLHLARPGPSRAIAAASTCSGKPNSGRDGGGARRRRLPVRELQAAVALVLLQQFHDILPGSSIAWVHREAERRYAAVAGELEAIDPSAAARAGRRRRPGNRCSTRAVRA